MLLAPLAGVAVAWSEPVAAGAVLAVAFVAGCVAAAGAMLGSRPETVSSASSRLTLATTVADADARARPAASAVRSAERLRHPA